MMDDGKSGNRPGDKRALTTRLNDDLGLGFGRRTMNERAHLSSYDYWLPRN